MESPLIRVIGSSDTCAATAGGVGTTGPNTVVCREHRPQQSWAFGGVGGVGTTGPNTVERLAAAATRVWNALAYGATCSFRGLRYREMHFLVQNMPLQ